jgi:hypothetical protein
MAERRSQRGLLDPESEAIAEAYAALPAVRRQTRGLLSLEPQQDQSMAQTALEAVLGFIPGVGQALAARDIERARRADDPAAAAMAATEFLPLGRMLGGMRRGGPIMSELDVYHGTPHKFPATEANPLGEFDASKIGTGEGAQAYGHGIYYAENPNVAQSYTAAGGSTTGVPQSYAADVVGMMGGEQKAIEHLKRIMPPKGEKTFSGESREFIEQTLRDVESGAYKAKQGSLYKADLPDEMIDRMLDWDKPLSKDAPQAVKDAFNKLAQNYPELKDKLFAAYREGKPGSHYYSLLNDYAKTGDLVKNQSFASDAMRQAGIPGIKYADAGSRGQGGSGTRNFVVFPGEEKKVKILERK